jgi:hypothetical protein
LWFLSLTVRNARRFSFPACRSWCVDGVQAEPGTVLVRRLRAHQPWLAKVEEAEILDEPLPAFHEVP